MAKVKVVIAERNGELVVEPAVAVLEKNGGGANVDKLKIFNSADEDVVIHIYSDEPFGNAGSDKLFTIASKKASVLKPLNAAAVEAVYSYQVLGIKTGRKGKGNSDPMLIIDN